MLAGHALRSKTTQQHQTFDILSIGKSFCHMFCAVHWTCNIAAEHFITH